jgi:hypothetical protein
MSQTHESIMTTIQTYSEENSKFTEKGVKASATQSKKSSSRTWQIDQSKKKRDSRN